MYYGESQTAIDDKGRITVPQQFRQVMEVHDHDTWFMTRGFDGAIFLFHKEQWEKLKDLGSGHSPLDPRMLEFRDLVDQVDPGRTFGSEFLDRYVHGVG